MSAGFFVEMRTNGYEKIQDGVGRANQRKIMTLPAKRVMLRQMKDLAIVVLGAAGLLLFLLSLIATIVLRKWLLGLSGIAKKVTRKAPCLMPRVKAKDTEFIVP